MDASQPVETKLDHFIRFEFNHTLPKKKLVGIKKIIEYHGPPNIMAPIAKTDDKGKPQHVWVVHKAFKTKQRYDFPLKRDLMDDEVASIVDAFNDVFDDDYTIESSADDYFSQRDYLDSSIVLEQDDYEEFCLALSKTQHQKWMEDREQDGWKYGQKYSRKQKTHPMMRPWHDLPDKYKQIDYDTPQTFIEQLNEQGYAVVKMDQLDEVFKKAYGKKFFN